MSLIDLMVSVDVIRKATLEEDIFTKPFMR